MTAKTVSQMVRETRERIDNLTPDQVEAEVAQGALLVDVREDAECNKTGRIPGSVHVARGLLEFQADPSSPAHQPAFDPGARVILYCAAGGRSALSARTLMELGYTNVAHLDGGMQAWQMAGKPVVNG